MSNFYEINFEQPGYPIYRAFIVPYRQDEKLYDVIEVKAKEIELWREMLKRLRNFLLNAMDSLAEINLKLGDHERLELIGDLISLFFRIPLNREVIPSVSPSPLKAYLLMRLMRLEELFGRSEFDPIEFTETFYDKHLRRYLREEERYPKLSKILRDLEVPDLSDLLEKCWFLIPADTRPVLNTASLISHLLLTSAIAWSRAINEGVSDRRTLARLRLAALLHDIGKPFKYRDHVRVSIEVAEKLLSELLSREDIEFICECIKDHHIQETRQGKIIGEADGIASAIDRLMKLIEKSYEESDYFKDIRCKLENALRALNYDSLEKAFNDWDFWRRIYEEYDKEFIKNLSEEFVKRVREITNNFITIPPKLSYDASKPEHTNIRVLLIDVGGIQNFIFRSHSLRQVAAASLVIDTLVMAYIVAYLQWAMSAKYWLPYENFLYTAGGNIEILVPSGLISNIMNAISGLNRQLTENYGIPLRVVDAELYKNRIYSETVKELIAKMSINKVRVAYEKYSVPSPEIYKKGIKNVCQSCFMEPPTEKLLTPEGETVLCRVCYNLHNVGFNIHFKEKYESEISISGRLYRPREVFEIPWDGGEAPIKASERIMEIIAGHDLEDLQKLGDGARMRNIAVIKVDGTLMGPFMATCLSIADAYERSARIDIALKKSIEFAVSEVYKGVAMEFCGVDEVKDAAKAAISIKMGILYAGGDDAIILAPSWTSPLIALVLGKEFLYNLGCTRGLSIGIAVAGPKANIWALIDASSKLMDIAKKEARKRVREGRVESLLSFDIIEAGDLSGSTIEERHATLLRERLTVQPFDVNSFQEMLRKILEEVSGQDCSREYSEIARLTYLASRNIRIFSEYLKKHFKDNVRDEIIKRIEHIQDNLKGIRSAINETLQAAKSIISKAGNIEEYVIGYVFLIAYIYACRQAARVGKHYEFVRSLIPDRLDASSSLSDVDRLIKIIGGGVI